MALTNHSLKPTQAKEKADPLDNLLASMSDRDLLKLRHKIDLKLNVQVKDLSLTDELGLQYRQGKTLLDQCLSEGDATPVNQKAQVFNSVSAMLDKIIKQVDMVNSAERTKRYEVAFLKVLEKLPAESKEIFFDLYGEYLKDRHV